jgi:protein ImuB
MFACLHSPGNLPLLVECAGYFSPLIEESTNDSVVFDIRGLRLIYGTPEQIAQAIELRMGVKANLAIASNPDAAMHAARGIRGVTVIPPGREADVLARLPLFLLGGSAEFARTLDTWGIRTFGEFAALPPLGIAARLGDEGMAMQRLARGEGQRLLATQKDALEFFEEFEPESSIDLMEPLLLLIGRMLNDLCARIASHSLGVNQVRLHLKMERLENRPVEYSLVFDLPVPMLNAQVFLKLLQLEMAERPPESPIEKIRVDLMPVQSRATQHGLFLPASPEPEKLEITMARIRGLVGAANLGVPELVDTHRPDSFRLGSLRGTSGTHSPTVAPQGGAQQCLILRRFRPPQHAQVWRGIDGRPSRISFSRGDGRVVACAGPWRTSGDWWTGESWDREEWDVEITAALLRIHRDCRRGEWFVEGSYD